MTQDVRPARQLATARKRQRVATRERVFKAAARRDQGLLAYVSPQYVAPTAGEPSTTVHMPKKIPRQRLSPGGIPLRDTNRQSKTKCEDCAAENAKYGVVGEGGRWLRQWCA